MAKAVNKTQLNDGDVEAFLNSVEHPQKREDSFRILEMMKSITKEEATMWGDSIVGFGQYHYKYQSGREGDWFLTGFSPRKQNLTMYIMAGLNKHPELIKQLGKCKTSKACLYINKLADVDENILAKLIKLSADYTKKNQSGC